ncbi:hypothetical protein ACGFS9_24265 [Streptomyces sp. NPDC048566]|uniref:hypothetical protein n=1 Tax=Streptomyces sp. NPDC048566 TaxID=3365569 RepID=UPI00371E00D9
MTTDPRVTIADSAHDPDADIWFAEPPGFVAVPIDALLPPLDSPAEQDVQSALGPLLSAAPDEMLRQQLIGRIAQSRYLLGGLWEAGVVHCSIGLHRDDVAEGTGSPPLLSFLTLSWRTTAVSPRAVTAARAVSAGGSRERVEYAELPCGPVTFSETLRTPRAGGGLPELPLMQFSAHLPHPDCRRLAVFTLSTAALARHEEYRAILRQVAGTAAFESPLAAPTG